MKEDRRFRAPLVRDPHGLGWTVAFLPFNPAAAWPRMVRLRVRGEIRGPMAEVNFRTSLFASREGETRGGHFLLVNSGMQRGSGALPGMEAEFCLRPDLEERPAELPLELDALLDEAEGLRAWYGELSAYTRREVGKWVGGVKSEAARIRRAEQMAERMLSTMEAEAELPPVLERAFRARPRARLGWEAMTAAQRRGELFAVFYYGTPEARQRRAEKLVEAAEQRALKAGRNPD